MENLTELYTEIILDHGRNPRNEGEIFQCRFQAEGFNPLCGDRITIFVRQKLESLDEVGFSSDSCLISRASASLMTQLLAGNSMEEAEEYCRVFTEIMRGERDDNLEGHGVADLLGIRKFPTRVKCVTLPWLTFLAALKDSIPI